jgi:hypothetical protein
VSDNRGMDAVDVVALSGRLPDIVLKEYRHWTSIELSAADPGEVFEILADAWRMTATRKAVAAYDAANPATP